MLHPAWSTCAAPSSFSLSDWEQGGARTACPPSGTHCQPLLADWADPQLAAPWPAADTPTFTQGLPLWPTVATDHAATVEFIGSNLTYLEDPACSPEALQRKPGYAELAPNSGLPHDVTINGTVSAPAAIGSCHCAAGVGAAGLPPAHRGRARGVAGEAPPPLQCDPSAASAQNRAAAGTARR